VKDLFISNNTNISFLNKIKESLSLCKECYLSVSFIKKAGLVLFEKELTNALKRGAKIKIITSTYQNFTDIPSLCTFLDLMKKFPNFSVHLDLECFGDNGFHSKGYIFVNDDATEFIVGSTNITRYAILKNIEWNVSLYRNKDERLIKDVLKEFNLLYDATLDLSEELVDKYKMMLSYSVEKWDMDYFNPDVLSIKPNQMQRSALKELRRYRDLGVTKSLVVAATGSGKTYLAAFDARNFYPKRLLYIVHRETILSDALNTFKKIFGSNRSYGFFTGNKKEIDADFIFATSIMISKHLDEFDPLEFDYIVYDEVHHIMADTGKRIFTYFSPLFLLGLTATPERMDQQDVLELFENNVPFELRLRDAIINGLVSPFHYYGIRDEFVDYGSNDKAKIAREITKLNNVEHICKEIEKHKQVGKKLKALAFCTSIEHAKMMEYAFNDMGYNATSLTGINNFGQRVQAFKNLQDDNNPLEIICAVDILNEGVDIPSVNMVLFLRPTESQTVFLQQLGRGLRLYPGKDYVTVLDFIGNNYDRATQIALALGTLGKTTYTEKTYLTDLVSTNFSSLSIPGVEIFLDDLVKVEMINYINKQNFNLSKYLKKDYENFKKYLQINTYPSHMDYINSDIAPDIIRFMKTKIDGNKNKSYYSFLKKIGEEAIPYFNESEVMLIDKISELLPIVRCDEILLINQAIEGCINIDNLINYNSHVTSKSLNHALNFLIKEKIITSDLKLNVDIITQDLKLYLTDLIEFAFESYERDFNDFEGLFKLMGNYYKEQIMNVLLGNSNDKMKGTKCYDDGTTILFVGLKKDSSKEEKLNYKDKFLSSKLFQWESEVNTRVNNKNGIKLLKTKVVHLFIRKMKEQDGITLPFTYFGTGVLTNMRETKTQGLDTLTFDIVLDNEVKEEYFLDFEIEKK